MAKLKDESNPRANRGNDDWNSDEPMPWPKEYFGVRPERSATPLADAISQSLPKPKGTLSRGE
jgi:hypothetical protein